VSSIETKANFMEFGFGIEVAGLLRITKGYGWEKGLATTQIS